MPKHIQLMIMGYTSWRIVVEMPGVKGYLQTSPLKGPDGPKANSRFTFVAQYGPRMGPAVDPKLDKCFQVEQVAQDAYI